MDFNLAS